MSQLGKELLSLVSDDEHEHEDENDIESDSSSHNSHSHTSNISKSNTMNGSVNIQNGGSRFRPIDIEDESDMESETQTLLEAQLTTPTYTNASHSIILSDSEMSDAHSHSTVKTVNKTLLSSSSSSLSPRSPLLAGTILPLPSSSLSPPPVSVASHSDSDADSDSNTHPPSSSSSSSSSSSASPTFDPLLTSTASSTITITPAKSEKKLKKNNITTRYFLPTTDISIKCHNCGTVGHHAYECTKQKLYRPCWLCGERGHPSFRCPRDLCYRCLKQGHMARDCLDARVQTRLCYRCGSFDHTYEECSPSQVAKSDLSQIRCFVCGKTGHVNCQNSLNSATPTSVLTNHKAQFCCNCGGQGHVITHCQLSHIDLNVSLDANGNITDMNRRKGSKPALSKRQSSDDTVIGIHGASFRGRERERGHDRNNHGPSARAASAHARFASVECYHCSKTGHIARECPNKQYYRSDQPRRFPPQSEGKERERDHSARLNDERNGSIRTPRGTRGGRNKRERERERELEHDGDDDDEDDGLYDKERRHSAPNSKSDDKRHKREKSKEKENARSQSSGKSKSTNHDDRSHSKSASYRHSRSLEEDMAAAARSSIHDTTTPRNNNKHSSSNNNSHKKKDKNLLQVKTPGNPSHSKHPPSSESIDPNNRKRSRSRGEGLVVTSFISSQTKKSRK